MGTPDFAVPTLEALAPDQEAGLVFARPANRAAGARFRGRDAAGSCAGDVCGEDREVGGRSAVGRAGAGYLRQVSGVRSVAGVVYAPTPRPFAPLAGRRCAKRG